MADLSVFSFGDYGEYLSVAFHRYQTPAARPLNLSQWARKLGYRSPRSIAMVLKKQRLPTADMIGRLSESFAHSDTEHRYFELLVQLERERKRGRDFGNTLRKLETLNPNARRSQLLMADEFAFVSEWYHIVIKQLVATPGFREDAAWVREVLRGKVSNEEFYNALKVMLQLGILKRHPRTRKLQVSRETLRTTEDIPSVAIRNHHRQMLTRAMESLEEQGVDEREITSKTLRMDPARMGDAKRDIRRFKQAFEKKYECLGSSAVYQLNLQLFPHTKGRGE